MESESIEAWKEHIEQLRGLDIEVLRAEEKSLRDREDFLMDGLENLEEKLKDMSNTDKLRTAMKLMDKVGCMIQRMDLNRIIREKEAAIQS